MLASPTNVFRIATGASQAFAPAISFLDPTPDEAIEEYRRAKSYRSSAPALGFVAGGAIGLALFMLRGR